jgi:hypothetical protein
MKSSIPIGQELYIGPQGLQTWVQDQDKSDLAYMASF